ncbi:DUF4846 domain-containing protein [Hymenobacter cellulosilyticus]|uniref:DUF4846 domain-containing protein n=1 Tax=Hymenobacter cellulosilyticus TaxID=2932248 RepID=A0A8T9Q0E1_9BACT|nr:DUF4846 domain-containing protein [Hymenobacter cellulosilyticus]UOQ70485.1 DUF4846 domain-containing protein [Hymenobacter cellulosilyticus]
MSNLPCFVAALSLLVSVADGQQPTAARPATPTTAAHPYGWLPAGSYQTRQTLALRFAPPAGAQRVAAAPNSFAQWLRYLPLQPAGAAVHLHNGKLKTPQTVHAAVVRIDVGPRDLQQCADAVIRLRGEYLFSQNPDKVHFHLTSGHDIWFSDWHAGKGFTVTGEEVKVSPKAVEPPTHPVFRRYLDQIFTYAGTRSIEREMQPVALASLQPGDVFVRGGSPGHAVLVLDVSVNSKTGRKYFLLAQSYMPAQEIHVLRNLQNPKLSPWYELNDQTVLETPEWSFTTDQLRRF